MKDTAPCVLSVALNTRCREILSRSSGAGVKSERLQCWRSMYTHSHTHRYIYTYVYTRAYQYIYMYIYTHTYQYVCVYIMFFIFFRIKNLFTLSPLLPYLQLNLKFCPHLFSIIFNIFLVETYFIQVFKIVNFPFFFFVIQISLYF